MIRFFLFFLLFFAIYLESEPLKVSVQAKGAILINAENGAVLFEKNAEERCFPASTTKIATLIYLLEKHPTLHASITISKNALGMVNAYAKKKNLHQYPPYILEHDGTMMGVKSGEIWPFETLLYGLMLSSGNDAANALAEFSSNNIEQFVGELNQFIQNTLGLKNTNFRNPHGLHLPDHYTTAYDLAKMTQYALKNEKFREIVKTRSFDTSSPNLKMLTQHNRLLKKGPYFYSKAIGVKTGYHSNGGHSLVAAAEHEGRTLIAVLMGYEDPNLRFKDAINLFEKAFKEKKVTRTLFTKQFDVFAIQIPKADKLLNAKLSEDIQLAYFPAEEPKLQTSIHWKALSLPIEKEACVGEIKLTDDKNNLVLSAFLYADEKIEKKLIFKIIDFCKNKYFQAALIETTIVTALIFYFRKRRVNKRRQAAKERSSGRE